MAVAEPRVRDLVPRRSNGKVSGLLLKMCQLIINEWVQDKCRACGGRGRTGLGRGIINGVGKLCRPCKGTGKQRINGAERGRLIGVSSSTYWRIWHPRFTAIRTILIEADFLAVEEVRTALRGERHP